MRQSKGFTLVQLVVVICIVGLLTAVGVLLLQNITKAKWSEANPLMQEIDREIDRAKWEEAKVTAATIRIIIQAYADATSVASARRLVGKTGADAATRDTLCYDPTDLDGTYFIAGDYSITAVDAKGVAEITVQNGSQPEAPSGGPYVLRVDGSWGP
ncbi:MAG: hypothetical protein ABIF19_02980 [Planctomycetota bacterium]